MSDRKNALRLPAFILAIVMTICSFSFLAAAEGREIQEITMGENTVTGDSGSITYASFSPETTGYYIFNTGRRYFYMADNANLDDKIFSETYFNFIGYFYEQYLIEECHVSMYTTLLNEVDTESVLYLEGGHDYTLFIWNTLRDTDITVEYLGSEAEFYADEVFLEKNFHFNDDNSIYASLDMTMVFPDGNSLDVFGDFDIVGYTADDLPGYGETELSAEICGKIRTIHTNITGLDEYIKDIEIITDGQKPAAVKYFDYCTEYSDVRYRVICTDGASEAYDLFYSGNIELPNGAHLKPSYETCSSGEESGVIIILPTAAGTISSEISECQIRNAGLIDNLKHYFGHVKEHINAIKQIFRSVINDDPEYSSTAGREWAEEAVEIYFDTVRLFKYIFSF